jgi:hypothetical protein
MSYWYREVIYPQDFYVPFVHAALYKMLQYGGGLSFTRDRACSWGYIVGARSVSLIFLAFSVLMCKQDERSSHHSLCFFFNLTDVQTTAMALRASLSPPDPCIPAICGAYSSDVRHAHSRPSPTLVPHGTWEQNESPADGDVDVGHVTCR